MTELSLRPVADGDAELLRVATLGNLNWCGERFGMDDVIARPEFARYTVVDPARGDFGQVAVEEDRPVGVCWAQLLPADDPGYGFVDQSTPEISLWVHTGSRGRGIGRLLLKALIAEAHSRGFAQISLSVEADNYARSLYTSAGFVDVAGREADGVMLLRQ